MIGPHRTPPAEAHLYKIDHRLEEAVRRRMRVDNLWPGLGRVAVRQGERARIRAASASRSVLATPAEKRIFVGMGKSPRVTFKMKRIAEDDWQIVAECPGVETKYIKGLRSKAEVDEWLTGTRRIDWLRSRGYAK
jgi:hypothetical protein